MKPRIFVSSTFYDLKYVREDLSSFIKAHDFEPILFEDGDIGYVPGKPLDQSCYKTMHSTDMVLLIIGGNYGSPATGEKKEAFTEYMSVTRNEFKEAVDEEVKNERMKTELVTNVSHDLRTPLTAIITYTDLLKNEKDEEKRKEYISVLERKSLRLKVLIEDLFEISKAASKSVVMHFMKVDIVGLFKQVELENVEKIKAANLEFRTKIPEQKVVMWLDSEKTYRIFENLIVNITKYAMPHTRVYIDMTETEDGVHITMKNVSAAELNFNADEITDRFVRGDSARNTEGSGLGLAIAKSFAELQHGSLKISTEADLFKADLYLPKSKEMPEKPGGGYPENL